MDILLRLLPMRRLRLWLMRRPVRAPATPGPTVIGIKRVLAGLGTPATGLRLYMMAITESRHDTKETDITTAAPSTGIAMAETATATAIGATPIAATAIAATAINPTGTTEISTTTDTGAVRSKFTAQV